MVCCHSVITVKAALAFPTSRFAFGSYNRSKSVVPG
jgi:hypothetical protein